MGLYRGMSVRVIAVYINSAERRRNVSERCLGVLLSRISVESPIYSVHGDRIHLPKQPGTNELGLLAKL